MESEPIVVKLPLRLVTESNAKEHWRTKHKRGKAQRSVTWIRMTAALVGAIGSPAVHSLLPARITLTRIAPRKLDVDNAWSSVKHVIDGVADAFNLPDNDERFEWAVAQRKGEPNEYAVEIRIEAIGISRSAVGS